MKRFLFFFVILFAQFKLYGQRTQETINDNWSFSVTNEQNYSGKDLNDQQWQVVNLPHTWNTDAYNKKDYFRGSCWYRKKLFIDERLKNKELYIRFEAVNSLAEVFINGKRKIVHSGGYNAFTVNITDDVTLGQYNTIAVRVNNENINIPPLSGDFTIFGGIYRDVWLISTEKQHFNLSDNGSDGVFISTPVVSEKLAKLKFHGSIVNVDKSPKALKLAVRILDPNKKLVYEGTESLKIATSTTSFSKEISIANPALWSPDSPLLYTAEVSLISSNSKDVKDKLSITFGLRWFSVDAQNGFQLNGKKLKLIGVCRHQDQVPVGTALSDEMHRRDMEMIKDMGANFIRISHYPQDKALLEACDRLGILAWEEIPVVDLISKAPEFEENCKTALTEMIRQHYNHPSVVMWGYMNEVLIQLPYRYKKEELPDYYNKTIELAGKLEKLLKQEDPGRLSVMAFHGSQVYNETGLSGITDIAGWNLYQGWYESDITGFERFADKEHEKYPNRPLFISEFGAGSDRRLQSFKPEIFDFSMQWQQEYLEHYLPEIQKRNFIIGATEWNFIDFNVATRQESMPRFNNKGLVYNNRQPKDVYYYFKAFLRKDHAVLHIATTDWPTRTVISDSGKITHPVKIYSNCSSVRLWVNDQSLGQKETVNFNASWNVPLKEGRNRIKAVANWNGTPQITETEVFIKTVPDNITEQTINGLELAINAGSNCFFTDELSGLCWLPDRPYKQGGWGYIGGTIFRKSPGRIGTTAEITGTLNTPLFQTKRENPEAYRFDIPNGQYEVELSFADLYGNAVKSAYDLAKTQDQALLNGNEFNILINDQVVLQNFNPAAEAGNNFAIKKKFIIEVTNGSVNIKFKSIKGNSFINALKIRKI